MKHNYTLSGELPEMVQAKINAMNISEVKPHLQELTENKTKKTKRTHTETHEVLQTANQFIQSATFYC